VTRCLRLLAGAVLAFALAGCSEVTDGLGTVGSAAAPGSGAPAGGCPHIVYPGAHLTFDCIATGMRTFRDGPVWPFSERRVVEASTGWILEQGAGHWGSADGVALVDIALNVRQQMLDIESYGTRPAMHTVASRPTEVDGHRAYLLQTTFDLNQAWARSDGTAVRQERLWLLAVEVAPNDVSLWYVSVPDLIRSLWAKVPAAIATIKVS
jgi:hypothetical protein